MLMVILRHIVGKNSHHKIVEEYLMKTVERQEAMLMLGGLELVGNDGGEKEDEGRCRKRRYIHRGYSAWPSES